MVVQLVQEAVVKVLLHNQALVKMKRIVLFLLVVINFQLTFSQSKINDLLKKHNKNTIPYISAQQLFNLKGSYILLDAREFKEFNVSHIKNGIFVGYNDFNLKKTINSILPNKKDTKIIVYCSLGIRSEDIGEQLLKSGYTNIYNLHGGIFDWKNNGYPILNKYNQPTEKIHAFNKEWSIWLKKGIKVYE